MEREINIKLTKDGNQYCFLLGENLQEGIAGFGDTVLEALRNFTEIWGNDVENKHRVSHIEEYLKNTIESLEENK